MKFIVLHEITKNNKEIKEEELYLNPDFIHLAQEIAIEPDPDMPEGKIYTGVVFSNGDKIIVRESPTEIAALVIK